MKSFDSRDTIVLPSNGAGVDAVFVFPWEQDKRVQTMLARLGGIGIREDVTGSNGGKLLLTVRVPVTFLPDSQNPLSQLVRVDAFLASQKIERANWNDAIELLGYALDTDDPARRNLVVTLYFHAAAKINRDYSFSLKARDSFDRVWGQDDKWLGDNSYATTHWDAGDVIVEKFYPGLAACAPAGDYRLTVEVYDPITIRALPLLDQDGNIVELGATRVGAFQGVAQQC
ncbi:MAG: hypothetical protein HY258_01160 [Chloroflexi bacterium]|nr:hypothetical protein [Chloroflexota bacterium]